MDVVFFEDDGWTRLAPLNLLKHTSLLRWGTGTLLSLLAQTAVPKGGLSLWGREELRELTESSLGAEYNAEKRSTTLFINAAARPGRELREAVARKGPFAALAGERLVAARMNASGQGRRNAIRRWCSIASSCC